MARGYPDYEGPKSGMYLKPEWAALEAKDKTFTASGVGGNTADATATYAVPVGKTLYINSFSGCMFADDVADADNNQICSGQISNATHLITLYSHGGNGGMAQQFPKPIVITGGHTVNFAVLNRSNHVAQMFVSAAGYEV